MVYFEVIMLFIPLLLRIAHNSRVLNSSMYELILLIHSVFVHFAQINLLSSESSSEGLSNFNRKPHSGQTIVEKMVFEFFINDSKSILTPHSIVL